MNRTARRMGCALRGASGPVLLLLAWSSAGFAAPQPVGITATDALQPERDSQPAHFTHQIVLPTQLEPVLSGWLPTGTAAQKSAAKPRPIELAAGYTLVLGGATPQISAGLARASAAMHSRLSRSPAARGAYLVQFAATSPETARRRIERAGGSVIATLSDASFLVRMDARARDQLGTDPSQPWVETWEPAYKLSDRIDTGVPQPAALTALIFPDGDAATVEAALREQGATAIGVYRNGINQIVRFELAGDRVAAIAALSDVTWIEPTARDTTLNAQAQWVVQTNTPNSRRVWEAGLRGQGQVVMTSDSGIRTNHEMFYDPTADITDFGHYPAHRKIIAYLRGSDHPLIGFGDDAGSSFHGTHTAGTVAGNNDPTTAANPYDGMAKDAKLWFMDLGGDNSNGSIAAPADLNDLFQPSYTGNAGGAARIASNSWGSPGRGYYTLASMQVDQFMWNHPDYLILFANGNNSVTASVSSPASAKSCLSVGGTGNGADRTKLYTGTSRGPTADLRRKPTICAPGDQVGSSVGTTRYAYSLYSGTSMATPTAAGAMALVRQYLTEGWYPTGTPVAANAFTPSAALLKAMAVNAGENDVEPAHVPDNNVGWGRLNIDNVLYFPGDARRSVLVDATAGLMDRQFVEYQIQVADPVQPFSVSLCWTDAPGNPAFVRQIVNDLDLVVSNGAVSYVGNRMFNNVSIAGPGRDSINVEECVRVPAPAAGVWTVRVEGTRIAVGPQPFALCISGGVAQGTGSLALDRNEYALNDTLGIEVLDPNATDPVQVTVASPTDSWDETVTLHGASGVFRGSLLLAPSAPNAADGRLAVSSGDVVTVTYTDPAPAGSVTATATVNGQAPVITDVHARALASTTALVTWTTDVPATSRVRFAANGVQWSSAETAGFTRQHAVRLAGLRPGRNYAYDIESSGRTGATTRDNFGGAHHTFTTKMPGRIALVLNGASPRILDTWLAAFDALEWDVDVWTGPDVDPPLVGNTTVGLRSYSCVLWQVDPDAYPPISDAQRTAIDSLLDGGARLLITGHDIGYGLADASVFSYTPEREAWLESGLKTRYYYDELTGVSTFHGVEGDPTSGGYVDGIAYNQVRSSSTSDLVGVAPGTNGVGSVNWKLDTEPPYPCGIRWESNVANGDRARAYWGGQPSRLVAMYYEWAGLASASSAHSAARTDVLSRTVAWLLGRSQPSVRLLAPQPAAVVTDDIVAIRFAIETDPARPIIERSISYSPDGGESWKWLHTASAADSVYLWNVGGLQVTNTTRALVRVTATDDGTPHLTGADVTDATFTLARPNGDLAGPVLVAGSLRTTPTPVQAAQPTTLVATFTDVGRGEGSVVAAEFSTGTAAASPGAGTPLDVAAPGLTAPAAVTIAAGSWPVGPLTIWVRGRDAAGNWGPAAPLAVVVNGSETTDAGIVPGVDFVASTTPNPIRGAASFHFGLAQPGEVRLELFDVRGRRLRTLVSGGLAAGTHTAAWDGRTGLGERAAAGVYFLRLTTPAGRRNLRLVLVH